ncbi:phosphoserine phosphatase SerB [Zafaria sp. Z1313]|uniref:phosphoserine phosphatase SerB n=1 Tax=unclassified Zafaria TaxID=2828765 RepID=UPI002E79CE94|nr:phosphoserine phosphatase SerB [Zafaria sp. J156]MEE1620224.1 phosphoserine phosphatase SerB [Zafaria sp. J156]
MHNALTLIHLRPGNDADAGAGSPDAALLGALEDAGAPITHHEALDGGAGAGWRLVPAPRTPSTAVHAAAAAGRALLPAGESLSVVPAALAAAPRLLLVMDVDSTLIEQEVIEMLAAHAGKEAEVAAVTEAAMRGELDFAQSLHARVAVLAGLDESVIGQVRAAVTLSPGAEELVAAFHAAGHAVGVVSGGFIQVLEPLASRLGLDFAAANHLGIEGGRLTGTVEGDVVDRAAKEAHLRRWATRLGIPLEHTIAVGDGANDLDMVRAAGLGVAYNAKPALRAEAPAAIDFPRLDAVRHFAAL